MKIGIVGAPGSGKTALANELKDALEGQTIIVDGYVEPLEKEFNYAFGCFATYIGNLAIALDRFKHERAASQADHVISCGTVADTATYMASETTFTPAYEGLPRRTLSSLNTIGCIYADTFDYDYVFYIRRFESSKEEFINDLDRELETALRLFECSFEELTGAQKERAAKAIITVLQHNESPSTV